MLLPYSQRLTSSVMSLECTRLRALPIQLCSQQRIRFQLGASFNMCEMADHGGLRMMATMLDCGSGMLLSL